MDAEAGAACAGAIDDDGDTSINDGCAAVAASENIGQWCDDVVDNDGDGSVNDGCPRIGEDDDAPLDGWVNDGCPAVAGSETDVPNNAPTGYLTLLKRIAQETFKDVNMDGDK